MKFEYTLRNGTTIYEADMEEIHSEYEALCTGEYIQDWLTGGKMSDKIAQTIGCEVRRRMSKSDCPDEQYAIDGVLDNVMDNTCEWLGTAASPEVVAQCRKHFGLAKDDDVKWCTTFLADLFKWIYNNEAVKTEFENYFENEEYIC